MKNLKALIFDLIVIAISIASLMAGVFIIRGIPIQDMGSYSAGDFLNSDNGLLIYCLALAAISISGIVVIVGILQIYLSFKDKHTFKISIIIWIMALIALAFVLYGIIKFSDLSFIDSIKKTLDTKK